MIEDFGDFFRYQLSFVYVLIVIPVALTSLVPSQKTGVVQEFKAYRLQQFDLAGNQKGSRSWRVNFDAAALNSNILRRCLIVSWKNLAFTPSSLQDLLPSTLGAVVIIIPENLNDLAPDDYNAFLSMEERLMEKPFAFAVFLAPENEQLNVVLENMEQQKKHEQGTAVAALLSMVTANSYHFVSEIQASNAVQSNTVHNIVAKLSSFDRSDKVPTILLVAHYDSFGAAPALSFGADSNGSGMVALLEILRLFSKMYENGYTRARYNLVFLLSGAGKLNFMGTRQFIDDYVEQSESSNTPSSKIEFAICLDSLLSAVNETDLYVHVSKLPRNNTSVDRFYNTLQFVASKQNLAAKMVSKKINLGDEYLSWEHERFSIRKLYAFTLSRHPSPKSPLRRSILDLNVGSPERIDGLSNNIRVIAQALMNHVFQLPSDSSQGMFDDLKVDRDYVRFWFDHVTSKPRSMQNLTSPNQNGDAQPKNEMLSDIFSTINHYSNEAHYVPIKIDKRDPEFVLYGATVDILFAYRVKPAVFDLVLATFIAGYLSVVYLFVLNASVLQYKLTFWADSLKKRI